MRNEGDEKRKEITSNFLNTSTGSGDRAIKNMDPFIADFWTNWGRKENFPLEGSWRSQLNYIYDTIKVQLNFNELGEYSNWVFEKTLMLQLKNHDSHNPADIFTLPRDLPAIADCLRQFHEHIGSKSDEGAEEIWGCNSFNELHQAVAPYARKDAEQKYLAEEGGNGEAQLLTTLKDGTEVIKISSEEASKAYGSPRWDDTYGDYRNSRLKYEDDLLVILGPDEKRWQLHFPSGEFVDETGSSIENLSKLISKHEGLDDALIPYFEKGLKNPSTGHFGDALKFSDIKQRWELLLSVPAFKERALQEGSFLEPTLKDMFANPQDVYREYDQIFTNVVELLKSDKDLQRALEPVIFSDIFEEFHNKPDSIGHAPYICWHYTEFYNLVMSVETWKERAQELGIEEKSSRLLDETFKALDPETGEPGGYLFNYKSLCTHVSKIPDWNTYAEKKGYFTKAIDSGLLGEMFDEYEECAKKGELYGHNARDYINEWKKVLSVPEWREYALEEDKLGEMLETLFDRSERHVALTFMFMMRHFHSHPELRENLTPYINQAVEQSGGEKFFLKRSLIPAATEILKCANQFKEWREEVSEESLEIAMQSDEDFPKYLERAFSKSLRLDGQEHTLLPMEPGGMG